VPGELDFGPFLLLGEEARARLRAASTPIRFAAGDEVVREGAPADAAYALTSGRVRVLAGPDLHTLATLTAPVLVGELAALSGEPRNATVIATTACAGIRVPPGALRAAVAEDPAFAVELEDFARLRVGMNFLRVASPFADLPSRAIDELAARLVPVHFAPGEVLIHHGERGDDAYLVRVGFVEVLRGEGATDDVLTTLGPGAFVGEISTLTGAPRSATVRAKTAVEAFRLLGEDVRPVVQKHRLLVERLEASMQARHAPRRVGAATVSVAPDEPDAVILRDGPSGTYLRLTREARAIYDDLDGERTLRDLALLHFSRTGALDPQAVFTTVATLQSAGMVSAPRIASDERDGLLLRAANLLLGPRAELRDADRLAARLYRLVGFCFSRIGAAVAVLLGIAGLLALASVFRQASPADFGLGGVVVAFFGLFLAGIGHETAHALATKAEGRRVGRAGIGLLWFTPVIYVDTSDAWLIDRRRRAVVNAAGPLFNFALAGILGLDAAVTTERVQDLAIWLAATNLLSVVFNLSPLLEFDGYYVLEDLTNVNGLRRKSLRFVFRDLIAQPRRPQGRLETGFLAYSGAALVYVVAVAALALTGVPRFVSGILEGRVDEPVRSLVGLAAALALTALTIGPFIGEVLAARTEKAAG